MLRFAKKIQTRLFGRPQQELTQAEQEKLLAQLVYLHILIDRNDEGYAALCAEQATIRAEIADSEHRTIMKYVWQVVHFILLMLLSMLYLRKKSITPTVNLYAEKKRSADLIAANRNDLAYLLELCGKIDAKLSGYFPVSAVEQENFNALFTSDPTLIRETNKDLATYFPIKLDEKMEIDALIAKNKARP